MDIRATAELEARIVGWIIPNDVWELMKAQLLELEENPSKQLGYAPVVESSSVLQSEIVSHQYFQIPDPSNPSRIYWFQFDFIPNESESTLDMIKAEFGRYNLSGNRVM